MSLPSYEMPIHDLSVLKDWDNFTPSTVRYTTPPLEILEDVDVTEFLGCLERIKLDGSPLGGYVFSGAPSPGLVFNKKVLSVPLRRSDIKSLVTEAKHVKKHIHEIDVAKIESTNPAWEKAAKKGIETAMERLSIDPKLCIWKAANTTVITSPKTPPTEGTVSMNLHPVSNDHFASVFVFLPSSRSRASMEVRHRSMYGTHNLSLSCMFEPHFVACYTGVDSAIVKLSPGEPVVHLTYHLMKKSPQGASLRLLRDIVTFEPRQEVINALAGWAHTLASDSKLQCDIPSGHLLYQLNECYNRPGDKTFIDATGIANPEDRLVLSHLAPAAKYYGFKILFAHASIWESASFPGEGQGYDSDSNWDECLDEKDYNFEDGDSEPDRTETEVVLTELDGREIEDSDFRMKIEELLGDIVNYPEQWDNGSAILNCRINTQPFEGKELSVDEPGDRVWDSNPVIVTCGKRASFLVVVPPAPSTNEAAL
ncbi:hypothetical protein DFP72DRAFT_882183 [Ephemerocybe angulata]|uniref:Uncharacterized protein n=1 Tax=Ephemerocybe angulata TaxID=980116 RepID=A0A8H6I7N9_9AGAR|nr:hypothetical protein DFP72DRAFT_882183 [Tulosesus angulatus]